MNRDPREYIDGASLFEFERSNPFVHLDPLGLQSDGGRAGNSLAFCEATKGGGGTSFTGNYRLRFKVGQTGKMKEDSLCSTNDCHYGVRVKIEFQAYQDGSYGWHQSICDESQRLERVEYGSLLWELHEASCDYWHGPQGNLNPIWDIIPPANGSYTPEVGGGSERQDSGVIHCGNTAYIDYNANPPLGGQGLSGGVLVRCSGC